MLFGGLLLDGTIFRRAVSAWWSHNPPRLGAALAYYTVLSLAPLLVILVAIAGHFFGEEAARGQIFWQIRNVAGDQSAALVQTLLKDAAHHGRSGLVAGVFSFILLLIGASGVFSELRDDLNYIWEVQDESATWEGVIRQRLISFLLVLCAGLLVILSLTLSVMIQTASKFAFAWIGHSASLESLNIVATFIFAALVIGLMYRFLPAARVDWKDAAVGSSVTAALVVLGKTAVAFYLTRAGIGSTYGAAGSMVVLLVWVYYSSQIFLLGAEFTRVYAVSRGSFRSTRPSSVTRNISPQGQAG